ncbi:MAG TPA: response regulator transcription factor [Geothrix sp.]|jgi:DNA-binding response OmpR family regulator|nr:response regulator transcription factor [Geothrix sp.]
MHLLVIEDNPDLVANLLDFLGSRGHTVDVAYNGYAGLGFALENRYDAIVLDLMLPGIDGLEVCARLRAAHSPIPVLMLTARDSLEDKLEGFASGADDYLIKPFALLELEARLQALQRRQRPGGGKGGCLQVGDLVLDTGTLQVTRAGQPLELPPIPLKLLDLLMRRAPDVVSRAEMERAIWGETPPDSDALRAHLHFLRSAIDKPFPKPLLHTVRGFGYRLSEDDEA